MATRQDFELAFRLLIGHEGAFSNNRADPGNWTSGKVGIGTLKGTKYGISAAAYPNRNISGMQLNEAHDIYFADYWTRSRCDQMPPRLAFVVFDAAVNNGVGRAIRWLQTVLGVPVDGNFGPQTERALSRATDETHLLVEFHSHRLRFMCELSTWKTFRGGWSRRLVKIPLEAASYWPNSTIESAV